MQQGGAGWRGREGGGHQGPGEEPSDDGDGEDDYDGDGGWSHRVRSHLETRIPGPQNLN